MEQRPRVGRRPLRVDPGHAARFRQSPGARRRRVRPAIASRLVALRCDSPSDGYPCASHAGSRHYDALQPQADHRRNVRGDTCGFGSLSTGATWDTPRGAVHALDRLDCQLEVVVLSRAPRVDDVRRAFAQLQRRRTNYDIISAREDDICSNRASVDLGRLLIRIGQIGEYRISTGADVDRWSRCPMAHNDPSLAGRNLANVVDEWGQRRIAILAEMRSNGDIGSSRNLDIVGFDDRIAVRAVAGLDNLEVVAARRQLLRIGERAWFEGTSQFGVVSR